MAEGYAILSDCRRGKYRLLTVNSSYNIAVISVEHIVVSGRRSYVEKLTHHGWCGDVVAIS